MKKSALQRIVAIDLIRGYFLFVILIDHLGRNFSVYDIFTGGGRQWVSAAEGFFFVSGLMIGLVRGRKLVDLPLKAAAKKVWSRALQLYLWSIGLTTFFTIIAQYFATNPGLKPGAFANQPLTHFLSTTLSLRYSYGWADFLAYYAIYLAFTPLALWLLRAGRWRILLGVSACLWVIAGNVQLAWQLLFFSGAIAGFYLQEIEDWFKNLHRTTKKIIYAVFSAATAITISLSMFLNTIIDVLHNHKDSSLNVLGELTPRIYEFNRYHLAPFFDKYSLGVGRVVLFYIWFITLYLLVRKYESTIHKYLGWFFVPLGQNSLYVYITHAFIVFFVNLYLAEILPVWANILVSTAFLGFIWALVKTKFLFKVIPR